jgi:hypothetical protein
MTDDEPEGTTGDRESEPDATRACWTRTEPPSSVVVETVAATLDREPTAVPPLGDRVDPAALDRMVERAANESRPVRVAFTYADVEVTVESGGCVTVRPGALDVG